jgi:hypothetical protein
MSNPRLLRHAVEHERKGEILLSPLELGTNILHREGTRIDGGAVEILGPIRWDGEIWTCLANAYGTLAFIEVTLWADKNVRLTIDGEKREL